MIIIYASHGGIYVEFESLKINNTTLVFLLLKCLQLLNSFKTHPLNIIFDGFGIWLLGYRTEFICLHTPQGHNFISTLWLWRTDEYVSYFYFERKSIFNKHYPLENTDSITWLDLLQCRYFHRWFTIETKDQLSRHWPNHHLLAKEFWPQGKLGMSKQYPHRAYECLTVWDALHRSLQYVHM